MIFNQNQEQAEAAPDDLQRQTSLEDDQRRGESIKYQFISIVQRYNLWPELSYVAPFISPATILRRLLVGGDEFRVDDNWLVIPDVSGALQSLPKQLLFWLFGTTKVFKIGNTPAYKQILREVCSNPANQEIILSTTGEEAHDLAAMNVREVVRTADDIADYPEYPKIFKFSNTILVDYHMSDASKRSSIMAWLGLQEEARSHEILAWYHQIVVSFNLEPALLAVAGRQVTRSLSVGDSLTISRGLVQLPASSPSMKDLEREILTNLFEDPTIKQFPSFDLTTAFRGLLMTNQDISNGLKTVLDLSFIDLMAFTVRESVALGGALDPTIKVLARTKTLLVPEVGDPGRLAEFISEFIAENHVAVAPTPPDSQEFIGDRAPSQYRLLAAAATDWDGRRLPDGWEARMDTNGRIFYLNHETRTTQWARPEYGTQSSTESGETQFQTRRNISAEDDDNRLEDGDGDATVDADDEGLDVASAPSAPDIDADIDNSLPSGWEMKQTAGGRIFFVNHMERLTTWVDPRTGKPTAMPSPSQSNSHQQVNTEPEDQEEDRRFRPLPDGWEEKTTPSGKVYFVDHNTMRTTWKDPRLDGAREEKLVPYSRDYKTKYEAFMREMKRLPAPPSNQKFEINVRRSSMLDDSFRAIMGVRNRQTLRSKLWINFEGEAGLDFGGVSREWFSLISKEIFNPYYGLFEYSASDNYTLQINPNSGLCTDNHLEYFRFVGRMAGMAAFHKRLLDGFFIRPFYKMMLNAPVLLKDMEHVDIEYYNSLLWIRNNDPECLDLAFECETEVFGEKVGQELKPGGANIPVTEENKLEYISLVIKWRFESRIKPQMTKFLDGFNDIVPLRSLQVFDSGELELLLSGVGTIDVDDWRRNSLYKGGYSDHHVVIGWFWHLVFTFGDEMRSRLLQFVTGTSRVPMNGFKVRRAVQSSESCYARKLNFCGITIKTLNQNLTKIEA